MSVSKVTDLVQAPFAKAKGLEGRSRGRCRAVFATRIVLRGPFGAPQDEGGVLLKQALRRASSSNGLPAPAR